MSDSSTHPMLAGRPVMIGDRLAAVLPDDEAHEFFDENDDPIPQPFVVGSIHWDSMSGHAYQRVEGSGDRPVALGYGTGTEPIGWVVRPADGPLDNYEWPVTECVRADLTGAESWPEGGWAIRHDGRLVQLTNQITFSDVDYGHGNIMAGGPNWSVRNPATGTDEHVPLDIMNAEYRLLDAAAIDRIFDDREFDVIGLDVVDFDDGPEGFALAALHDPGDGYSSWHPDLYAEVTAAIREYPVTDAPGWLAPSAVLSIVERRLLAHGNRIPERTQQEG